MCEFSRALRAMKLRAELWYLENRGHTARHALVFLLSVVLASASITAMLLMLHAILPFYQVFLIACSLAISFITYVLFLRRVRPVYRKTIKRQTGGSGIGLRVNMHPKLEGDHDISSSSDDESDEEYKLSVVRRRNVMTSEEKKFRRRRSKESVIEVSDNEYDSFAKLERSIMEASKVDEETQPIVHPWMENSDTTTNEVIVVSDDDVDSSFDSSYRTPEKLRNDEPVDGYGDDYEGRAEPKRKSTVMVKLPVELWEPGGPYRAGEPKIPSTLEVNQKETGSSCGVENQKKTPKRKHGKKLKKRPRTKLEPVNERFMNLSPAEAEWFRVNTTKGEKGAEPVRIEAANITLHWKDLQTLRVLRWLNDEIVNSFAALLNRRNADHFVGITMLMAYDTDVSHGDVEFDRLFARPRPRTHMFNSFFFTRLADGVEEYNYSAVQRWPSRAGVDVYSLDLVLFPVNLDNKHWVLVAIDMRAREFVYLDSLARPDDAGVVDVFRLWLLDEIHDKHGAEVAVEMEIDEWRVIINPGYQPTQSDGSSCGVFTLYNADYLELGREMDFLQSDMAVLRKRTAMFLRRNRLPDHPILID